MVPYRSYRISNAEAVDRGLEFLSVSVRKALSELIEKSEAGIQVVSGRDRQRRSIDINSLEFDKKIFYYNMKDIPREPIFDLGNYFSIVTHRNKNVLIRFHGNWNSTSVIQKIGSSIIFAVWNEDYEGQALGFLKRLSNELNGMLEELDPTLGSPIKVIPT